MAHEQHKGTPCHYCGVPYEFGEYIWVVHGKSGRLKLSTCVACRNLVLKEKVYPKPHQDLMKGGAYVCIGGLALSDGFKKASKKWEEHVRT